jgi:arylsulfatase
MIGWTRPHFPNDVGAEFNGKSGIGKYGDSVVELDQRTGEVLDAIEEAGIEDNTIVVFVSDNGPTATSGSLDELYAGDTGPFRGELGDAYEGSIRTVGMVKWPGRIKPVVSNNLSCPLFNDRYRHDADSWGNCRPVQALTASKEAVPFHRETLPYA